MKVLQKFCEKYGYDKDVFGGLGGKAFNKVFWRCNVFSPKAIAYRKLSKYHEGKWEKDAVNNPKKVFFKWVESLVAGGKTEKALWWLREARNKVLDKGNVELAREINNKIHQLIGEKVNGEIERIYEDTVAVKNARAGVLKYIGNTRKSDLHNVPTFEQVVGGA